jgi:hypothetical protein
MSTGKIIAYVLAALSLIAAAILLVLGVLFVLGSTSANAVQGWQSTGIVMLCVGLVAAAIGIGIILAVVRRGKSTGADAPAGESVTLNIDLPGEVNLEQFKCENCNGTLSTDDIKMVAGAPTVNCPYCGAVYQLTEEPKW